MRTSGLWMVVAVVSALGCAGAASSVGAGAAPDAKVGYIAGAFSNQGTRGVGLGFALRDPGGKTRVVAFNGPQAAGTVSETRLALIAVPPGEYSVEEWIAISALGQVLSRSPVDGALAVPFVVRSGQIVFLGRFGASTAGFSEVTFSVHSERTSGADALAMLRSGYPRFSDAPMTCVLCSSPVPAATSTASSPAPVATPARTAQPAVAASPAALAPSSSPGPGAVVLHLHRPDGDYAGWGLATWETTEAGKPRRMIAGLAAPMPATGVDGFGAYWVLREGDYGDRRVGFLLRKAKQRDAAGLDRAWFLSASRHLWLNSGDPEVYFQAEKAIAARSGAGR